MPEIQTLCFDFRDVVNTILVYVTEAHADDEWPIGSRYNSYPCVKQPRTLAERFNVATQFVEHFGVDVKATPVLLDNPERSDPFEATYAVWPIRFYVFTPNASGMCISYKAQPKHGMFDLDHLRRYLESLKS